MDQIKSEFADQFTKCLKGHYKNRLPSFAKIARDFSLRAPHLPHVSAETVRHWVRGTSLPHVSRMQVLVDWLGSEVAASFDIHARALLAGRPLAQSNRLVSLNTKDDQIQQSSNNDVGTQELVNVLDRLNDGERKAIFEIALLLISRHRPPGSGNGQLLDITLGTSDPAEIEPDA